MCVSSAGSHCPTCVSEHLWRMKPVTGGSGRSLSAFCVSVVRVVLSNGRRGDSSQGSAHACVRAGVRVCVCEMERAVRREGELANTEIGQTRRR